MSGRSIELTEAIRTARLELAPLRPEDADEMVKVLADPALYVFTGDRPPSLAELQARYAAQTVGRSGDGTETWHNWIVRLRPDGVAIGYVQATIRRAESAADVAWLIGTPWQGRGFATEAARAMLHWLRRNGVGFVTAHVHSDHGASAAVAGRIGLEPTDELEDGERIWRSNERDSRPPGRPL
jgi:RimJ/RimL family protein N-acetyltransferase